MVARAIVEFSQFSADLEDKLATNKINDYKSKVGILAELYKVKKWGKFTRGSADKKWEKWIARAKSGFGESWGEFCDLNHDNVRKIKDVGGSGIRLAYAVHYCMHASEEQTDRAIARFLDKIAFGTFAHKTYGPLFEFATSDEDQEQPKLVGANASGAIFTYGYAGEDKIAVLGRNKEQRQLREFLSGDQQFLWLQLAGVAGQGKSRIAWELIQKARCEHDFNAGFMEGDALRAFKGNWETWQPDKPYLIVIDYMIERDKPIGQMMVALMQRANARTLTHPVRLILIERQRRDRGQIIKIPVRNPIKPTNSNKEKEPEFQLSTNQNAAWFDQIVKDAEEIDRSTNLTRWDHLFDGHGIIELERLDEGDLVSIAKQVASTRSNGQPITLSDKLISQSLRRFDKNGRPLYAYLLGIALIDQSFSSAWDQGDLLSAVLSIEQDKRWKLKFGEEEVPRLDSDIRSLHIAVFATIVRAVDRYDLQAWDEWQGLSDEEVEKALVLVNGPIGAGVSWPGDIIPGFFPDLLGEWFVLSVLQRQAHQLQNVITKAWQNDPEATSGFLQRLAQDFPSHKVTRGLLSHAPENQGGYLAFGLAACSILESLRSAGIKDPSQELVSALKNAADKGQPKAMHCLGYFCWRGYGMEKSDKYAFKWYKKSVEADYTLSMANISICYLNGEGTNSDPDQAFFWAKRAAQEKNVAGMNLLFHFHKEGIGTKKDIILAMQYLFAAVELHDTNSMVDLGVCYEFGTGVEKDMMRAVDLYRQAAEACDTTAMHHLGVCYEHGNGVKKDPVKATDWYRTAADAGDPIAMHYLGVCYEDGTGVEKSLRMATDWYGKAADAGFTTAMVSLGGCYAQGSGVEKDPAKAAHWYSKAADAGSTKAIVRLGVCYAQGSGVEKNPAEAVGCYRKAAEAGDAPGMRYLGGCYQYGMGVDESSEIAIQWYYKAIDAGDIVAMKILGDCYLQGTGVEADLAASTTWYCKAAEAGDAEAMVNLGVSYESGTGVEKNLSLAARWYGRAADAGNTIGARFFGDCYVHGTGVEKDPQKAISWFQKAADGGDASAMASLGDCYRLGTGIRKNLTKAVDYYCQAAKAGEPTAMIDLGICYENGVGTEKNLILAAHWYHEAAKAGDATGMRYSGDCYLHGTGFVKDPAQALGWYRRALEAGEPRAMVDLGICYLNGKGTEANPVRAFELFQKATEMDPAVALAELGLCFKNGIGTQKDIALAINCFRKGADAGDAICQRLMGICYRHGDGVEMNAERAFEMYLNAANAEDSEAMCLLGVCYSNGMGCDQNTQEALSWYNRAAEAGESMALINLGISFMTGDGVDSDFDKAIEYFRAALTSGNSEASRYIAQCYKMENFRSLN